MVALVLNSTVAIVIRIFFLPLPVAMGIFRCVLVQICLFVCGTVQFRVQTALLAHALEIRSTYPIKNFNESRWLIIA